MLHRSPNSKAALAYIQVRNYVPDGPVNILEAGNEIRGIWGKEE